MRKEDLAVIEDALNSALHLISNEMQCVIDDERWFWDITSESC